MAITEGQAKALQEVANCEIQRMKLDERQRRAVSFLRRSGIPWRVIGDHVVTSLNSPGITAAAAHSRWKGVEKLEFPMQPKRQQIAS